MFFQDEPLLYKNGTGYVPDLLEMISKEHLALSEGRERLRLVIVPVRTWEQLMSEATSYKNVRHSIFCTRANIQM